MPNLESLTKMAAELPLAEREQLLFAIQQSLQEDYDKLEQLAMVEHLQLCRQRLDEHHENPSKAISVDESIQKLRAIP